MRGNGRLRTMMALLLAVAIVSPTGLVGCKKEAEKPPAPPAAPAEPEVVEPVEEPDPIVWPLTGLPADEAEIQRRPLSIKIENSREARPQTGLQKADVVYESIAEGGITRFNAIYQSQLPDEAGPVRSARLSDGKIVPQYGALFAFSGASSAVHSEVRSKGLDNLSQDAGVTAPYRRSSNRYAPHNLYVDPAGLYDEAKSRGMAITADPKPLAFELDGATLDTTETATAIKVPFSPYNNVEWTFDESSSTYQRINDGAPFIDTDGNEQIHATNVVILFAKYIPGPMNKGSVTYNIPLDTEGDAIVFSGGLRVDGEWKGSADQPPVLTDAAGSPILLAPGNTWFQVVPDDVKVTATP